jgi:ribosomal protein L29
MKKNDIKALDKLSVETLREKLQELKKEVFKAYNARVQGTTKDVHGISKVKKDIARVLSVLKKKELGL